MVYNGVYFWFGKFNKALMTALEMSNGIRIVPVAAERMLNGSHGYCEAELDEWAAFKFTEVSEALAQVWTGIPHRFIQRLEELNEGMPVRNYALHQLRDTIIELHPHFDPAQDYLYVFVA